MVTATTGVTTAAWRIRATAAGVTTTAIAWLSSQLTIDKGSLFQSGLQVKTLTHQVASGSGLQLHTADILRYSEVLFLSSHLLVLDTQRKNGQVVDLHVLALQQELFDTTNHVGEQTLDNALGVRRIVSTHVLSQSIQVDSLFNHVLGEPLTETLVTSDFDLL